MVSLSASDPSRPAPRSPSAGALVFIGFMGAGKTAAARTAAAEAGLEALDSDAALEQRLGHSIAREFELHGEAAFREREEQLVLELLDRAGPRSVVALGGGSVLSARVREALERHTVALLDVDVDTAWQRTHKPGAGSDDEPRPLARDPQAFAALHAERRAVYERLADAFLPATREGVKAALDQLRRLAAAPRGTRLVWATSASGEYPVLIGRGTLGGLAWPLEGRRFAVSDEHVAPLYASRVGDLSGLVEIPAGEQHKTLATAERVWRALIDAGMTRADHVAAVGGGVVGDVAGFCAATYQRGVRVVHVPTTVVAQVDSAYGGKTGVDLPEAKNYIGAYHQPAAVVVDPSTLETLPAAEQAAGYAEVIKTALLSGGELWDRVAAGAGPDEDVILACARTKLAIVASDERDAGRRQMLNLGHTVGHAIETVTGYGRYRHGEAVGLGLLVALRLSGQDALREQVGGLLAARGLPGTLEGASAEDVVAATARDKKRLSGPTPFVLLEAPGRPLIGQQVDEAQLLSAVRELG